MARVAFQAEGEEFDLVRFAADQTRDLHAAKPLLYWLDLSLSALTGYGALALTIFSRVLAWKLLAGTVAILALYRAVSFIHELTHLKRDAVPGFRIFWNLIIGVPMLVPSFLYEGIHNLHHARTRYGTVEDPEYLPLAHMRSYSLPLFLFVSLLAPIALLLRFAILAPLSLAIPPLRKFVMEQGSALSISPGFRRKPPESTDWRYWEAGASLWSIALIGGTVTGFIPLAAFLIFLAIAAGVAFLNQLRTLVAHLWEKGGTPISVTAQYLDSVNVPNGVLAALWAPVGLRYHALHHLLPGIPYHGLGEAHRRLVTIMPAGSVYHHANHASLFGLAWRLFRQTQKVRV